MEKRKVKRNSFFAKIDQSTANGRATSKNSSSDYAKHSKKKRRFEVANDSLIEFTISYHESLKEKKSGSSADSIPNRLTRREANELFLSTTRTETKCS